MMVIGIDPHKHQHTAAALDRLTQQQVDSIAIEASVAGYRRLLAWAQRWPERTWAVENARALGWNECAQALSAGGKRAAPVWVKSGRAPDHDLLAGAAEGAQRGGH